MSVPPFRGLFLFVHNPQASLRTDEQMNSRTVEQQNSRTAEQTNKKLDFGDICITCRSQYLI